MSEVLERADALLSVAFVLVGAVTWVRVLPTLAPSKPARGASAQRHALAETLRITFVYGRADPVVRRARVLLVGISILGAVLLDVRLLSF
ncbi:MULTISPECIES: hypothetical protein [unclassified Phenylobacterium]|uniref:hypothetical protein n=1 Tax=unclassified Phenylobacterium TaxID=2640670 RepID=UPI00083B432B|nr:MULTISPECIES: hypothetical protein [unclassified Phenylobacterium]